MAVTKNLVNIGDADITGTLSANKLAVGSNATVSGNFSMANGNNVTASGNQSHAEGSNTIAQGSDSHAEGSYTIASNSGAHAEGGGSSSTKLEASGWCSHAEGRFSVASGQASHAEGRSGNATAEGAHSEGYDTDAMAQAAHAEGKNTKASGVASHAGGIGTIANQEGMTAIGKYNNTTVGNIGGDYLFVVGNGTASSTASRSNAFAVTTNGITASKLNLSGGSYQQNNNGGVITFGDGDMNYCYIKENSTDDDLEIFANDGIKLRTGGDEEQIITTNCDFSVSGKITASDRISATNGFFETSDIRKKNILKEIPLDKVYELIDKCQVVFYTLKEDPANKKHIGVIAQEIQQYFPELVYEDKDGFLSVDYAKISVILVGVVKNMKQKIGILEDRLNIIENKLNLK